MFPTSEALRLVDARSRREWLRIGGLGCLGLSLSDLLRARAASRPAPQPGSFGRAKSCLLIFLSGGPPQHETWDPKPEAPAEIRGPFGTTPTTVPGIHFSELLPRTARIAHQLAIVRSMSTEVNSHSSSGHYMLTGYPHPAGQAETAATSDDWPCLAATVSALKPSDRCPFSTAILPEPIVNNPGIPWPGQNAGILGAIHHPQLFKCDPTADRLDIDGLKLVEGLTEVRIHDRQDLRQRMEAKFVESLRNDSMAGFDKTQQQAFDVLRSSATRDAFALEKETSSTRDRFGRQKFGQSLLLARRLIETGVRLVQVNWPREPGDLNRGNPLWDTHQKNAERCRDVLCPTFDQSFPELIRDLDASGLLKETLVVVFGEFGRSPTINADGGRDHWGACFSIALAGAGMDTGRIIGASDAHAAFVKDRPVRPSELSATILHLLGIQPTARFIDTLGRPRTVTDGGIPMSEIVG